MHRQYRPITGGLAPPIIALVVIAISFLVLAPTVLREGGRLLAVMVLLGAAIAANAYMVLIRNARALWLRGSVLCWEAGFRSGAVDVTEIEEIRPMRLAGNVQVIVLRDQRPILTQVRKGIGDFNYSIVRLRPDLPVRLSWSARLIEYLPGRSRYR